MAEVELREFHARHRPTGFPKKPGVNIVALHPLRLQIDQFAPGARIDEDLKAVVFTCDLATARKVARTADVIDVTTSEPVVHESWMHTEPVARTDGWQN